MPIPYAGVRVLSADDVRRALPMAEAIEVMRTAFSQLSSGDVRMPVRSHIDVPEHDGTALFMPSYAPCFGNIAVKVVNVFAANAERGLPRIQALVCLFDGMTGTPRAILNGTSLTALRTGAASGVATDILARSNASTVAILGAGVQGRTQLEAMSVIRPIRTIRVYDPLPEVAHAFASEMSAYLGTNIEVATNSREAVAGADIVCAATVSSTPVFADADIAPGTHINAIGSYKPDVQEIPAETVCRAQIVVDHWESAITETGDLIIPLQQGLITKADIHAELGEILNGKAVGRTSDDAVTLFKSVGVAVQDLAAASRAFVRAEAERLGTVVPL
jgi:ornithine cyclodeaminase/alanine dehydrogenase-like protein (mu-crystallin family)